MKKKPLFPHILETHLVDHCNLNCKGCSHFAPLVKEEVFADVGIFARDMDRLRQLFGSIYELRLMGGEPLLHPELLSFIDVARKIFPKTRIAIFTNGIRLSVMNDHFWETCAKNNILIKISYYPIDLPLDKIILKAKDSHVRIKLPAQIKYFFKHMNINGNSDPLASFRNCRLMFKTPQLRDGRLYPCFFPAYAHIFNDYFEHPIDVTANNSIHIFECTDPSEILKLLHQPIPMCRWCLTRRNFEKWDLSRRDIDEWIGNEAPKLPHFFRKLNYCAISLYRTAKRGLNR